MTVVCFFLAVLGLLLPVSLHTLGRFPTYYTWMSVLPLCALIFALFELEFRRVGLWKGIVVWGLMGLACAAGLPLQIGSGIFWSKSRSYAEVKNIVRNLKPTDVCGLRSGGILCRAPSGREDLHRGISCGRAVDEQAGAGCSKCPSDFTGSIRLHLEVDRRKLAAGRTGLQGQGLSCLSSEKISATSSSRSMICERIPAFDHIAALGQQAPLAPDNAL